MTPAHQRRLAALQASNKFVSQGACQTNPLTGEEVCLDDLLPYLSAGEMEQFRAIRLHQHGKHNGARDQQESRERLPAATLKAILSASPDEQAGEADRLIELAFQRRQLQ